MASCEIAPFARGLYQKMTYFSTMFSVLTHWPGLTITSSLCAGIITPFTAIRAALHVRVFSIFIPGDTIF